MSKFGWSLPPGCGTLPGEEEYPCEVCGHGTNSCVCPECPVCGVAGCPDCYLDEWRGGHGLKLTHEQKLGHAEAELAVLQERVAEQQLYIDWLKTEKLLEEEKKQGK